MVFEQKDIPMVALTTDVSCLVGRTADEMRGESPPIPMVHPLRWYEPPTDAEIAGAAEFVDLRVMAAVTVCGPDTGRFFSLVAEDGVFFSNGYPGLEAAQVSGVDSFRYVNERAENMMAVVDASGETVEIGAGKLRFAHSPPTLDSIEDLMAWHADDEGAMARFRLHNVTYQGRELVVAAGGVLPSIMDGGTPRATTWFDLNQLAQAEVSPEFMELDTAAGPGTEFFALSLVGMGNTNTSLPRAAQVRKVVVAAVDPACGCPINQQKEQVVMSDVEEPTVRDTVEQVLDERAAAEAAEAAAEKAAADAVLVEELQAENQQLREEISTLNELVPAVELDLSPLN